MKRSDICKLLAADLSPEDFSSVYADELRRHVAALNKKGSSAPIVLTGDEYVFLNRKNALRVVAYVASGVITKELAGYLFDAFSLDEKTRFADDSLREAVLDLADSDFSQADLNAFSDGMIG